MSKEHAYAYEAGYRDGSIHYELEHCPACKNVADLQEALDENAKLREELEAVGTAAYLYGRTDLEAENAKLRELVRNVHALHWNGLDCTECPWFDECDTTGGCPWLSIFADHMRELGIEVDDA